jgi:hypothetical protein
VPLVWSQAAAELAAFLVDEVDPTLIKPILDHIRKRDTVSRPPPHPQPAVAHIA